MPTTEATPAKPPRQKKPPAKPLTQRVWEALHKHGPATADAVARRSGATAQATSKALAALKARGLTTFRRTKKGENVHSAKGKAWPTK
ncbi:MAG TPA: helix-turn-helix domain-containing protein [Terricaulis sp.]|nr:helix-turn-helix domain-containing protein [Terricaulis sp.]